MLICVQSNPDVRATKQRVADAGPAMRASQRQHENKHQTLQLAGNVPYRYPEICLRNPARVLNHGLNVREVRPSPKLKSQSSRHTYTVRTSETML
jgi:hypothetical protein